MRQDDGNRNKARDYRLRLAGIIAARKSKESTGTKRGGRLGGRFGAIAARARAALILVDTTVWIDLFRAKTTPETNVLESLIEAGEDICTCGIVLAEVLQGIRDDREYDRTRRRFGAFLYLPAHRDTFVLASEMYRSVRKRGITIRRSLDCMIAATAVAHKAVLLHSDRDYDPLSRHCGLKVYPTASAAEK